MKITEYRTATGVDAPALDENVNQLIEEGFEPYGNPYLFLGEIAGAADTFGMFQPMVKRQADNAPNPPQQQGEGGFMPFAIVPK